MSLIVAFLAIWALVHGASAASSLSGGGFTINGNTLWCNGVPEPDLHGFLEINGSGSGESSIRGAVVTIPLRGVSSTSSLRISCSEVTPLFDGTTPFGGIFYEDESNVTLAAIAGETLTSIADSGPGIGAPVGSFCESLTIMNGSIRAEGGVRFGGSWDIDDR
jgi:hypothetical protein